MIIQDNEKGDTMNAKRGFTLILVLALFAMVLTACGGKTDEPSDTDKVKATSTPVPTDTPTPTEAPKTPEQLDLAALDLFFESAATMAKGADFPLEEGAKFILKWENTDAVMELETEKTFKTRAWESWVHLTEFPKGRYTMQSEQYALEGAYGTITGTLKADGSISWVSDNINGDLYKYISARGVEQDPAYLARIEESKALQGEWNGNAEFSFKKLVEANVSANDKETLKYYNNLLSLLKKNGFSGNMPITINCYILSEKELIFSMYVDWTSFLSAIEKATNSKDNMLNFLSVVIGASKSDVSAAIKAQGTDVMTFGNAVVRTLKDLCDSFPGVTSKGAYTIDKDTVRFAAGQLSDYMIYDRNKNNLIYADESYGLDCRLKKKE